MSRSRIPEFIRVAAIQPEQVCGTFLDRLINTDPIVRACWQTAKANGSTYFEFLEMALREQAYARETMVKDLERLVTHMPPTLRVQCDPSLPKGQAMLRDGKGNAVRVVNIGIDEERKK